MGWEGEGGSECTIDYFKFESRARAAREAEGKAAFLAADDEGASGRNGEAAEADISPPLVKRYHGQSSPSPLLPVPLESILSFEFFCRHLNGEAKQANADGQSAHVRRASVLSSYCKRPNNHYY